VASPAQAGQRKWEFGFHPAAAGSVVRTLTRVDLQVGDALRLEMSDQLSAELVHIQYFIATGSGGWALWISCRPDELAGYEAALPDLAPPDAT
jgi:hypothetical protein